MGNSNTNKDFYMFLQFFPLFIYFWVFNESHNLIIYLDNAYFV